MAGISRAYFDGRGLLSTLCNTAYFCIKHLYRSTCGFASLCLNRSLLNFNASPLQLSISVLSLRFLIPSGSVLSFGPLVRSSHAVFTFRPLIWCLSFRFSGSVCLVPFLWFRFSGSVSLVRFPRSVLLSPFILSSLVSDAAISLRSFFSFLLSASLFPSIPPSEGFEQ